MKAGSLAGPMAALPIVFMFSGQGSQYYQMGRQLYEHDDTFRRCMDRMDAQVEGRTGRSVLQALYFDDRGKADLFDDIRDSHPAIAMVELALAQTLMAHGVRPAACLGVSVGTFAAAAIAGALTPEQALDHVASAGMALHAAGETGGMLAVMADPAVHGSTGLDGLLDVAAYNFDGHHVLAGPSHHLDEAARLLSARDIHHLRVPVRHAFHSRWFEPLKPELDRLRPALQPVRARLPIACCQAASLLYELPGDHFWRIAREPIRFQQTVVAMETQGPWFYLDVGPSGTLSTFLKYQLAATGRSHHAATLTPFAPDARGFARALELASPAALA